MAKVRYTQLEITIKKLLKTLCHKTISSSKLSPQPSTPSSKRAIPSSCRAEPKTPVFSLGDDTQRGPGRHQLSECWC